MRIPQNAGGESTLFPAGMHQSVIVDWHDYGWPRNSFKGDPKPPVPALDVVFQIAALNDFNERFTIKSDLFRATWGKNSGWPKFLGQLIGAASVNNIKETGVFDMDSLICRNVWINVEHIEKEKNGEKKIYAEITNYMIFGQAQGALLQPEGYTRDRDRYGYLAPVPSVEDDNFENFISTAPLFVFSNGEGFYKAPPFLEYAEGQPEKYGTVRTPIAAPPIDPRSVGVEPEQLERARATRSAPDPRSVNTQHNPAQYAKDVAAGRAPTGIKAQPAPVLPDGDDFDDDDPFADQ